jgi:hypothetical protein
MSSGAASRAHRKLAQSSGVALQRLRRTQDAETGRPADVRRRTTCHTRRRFGFLITFDERISTMQGVMTFNSLSSALRAGYQVYDRTENGYLVRIKTQAGWALARVHCK